MELLCIRYVLINLDPFAKKHKLTIIQCVDITFAEPKDVPEVNETNCFNSSDISFNNVYSISQGGPTSAAIRTISTASLLPLAGLLMYAFL